MCRFKASPTPVKACLIYSISPWLNLFQQPYTATEQYATSYACCRILHSAIYNLHSKSPVYKIAFDRSITSQNKITPGLSSTFITLRRRNGYHGNSNYGLHLLRWKDEVVKTFMANAYTWNCVALCVFMSCLLCVWKNKNVQGQSNVSAPKDPPCSWHLNEFSQGGDESQSSQISLKSTDDSNIHGRDMSQAGLKHVNNELIITGQHNYNTSAIMWWLIRNISE